MEIYPANYNNIVSKKFVNLYKRILKLTVGASIYNPYYYHLYIKCQIQLQDDRLVYYISEITGETGEYCTTIPKNPFKIIVRDKELVPTVGSLSYLISALNTLEAEKYLQDRNYRPSLTLRYKQRFCSFIEKEIHRWVMKGCPNVGLSYQLNIVNNELSVLTISTKDISISLLGMSHRFISIIDRTTGDRWTFTNNPNYCYVYCASYSMLRISSDCFTPFKTNISGQCTNNFIPHFVTPDLKARAKKLLIPLIELLLQ
jgi:hypothetical protein